MQQPPNPQAGVGARRLDVARGARCAPDFLMTMWVSAIRPGAIHPP